MCNFTRAYVCGLSLAVARLLQTGIYYFVLPALVLLLLPGVWPRRVCVKSAHRSAAVPLFSASLGYSSKRKRSLFLTLFLPFICLCSTWVELTSRDTRRVNNTRKWEPSCWFILLFKTIEIRCCFSSTYRNSLLCLCCLSSSVVMALQRSVSAHWMLLLLS